LEQLGYRLLSSYDPKNRVGDHVCYISDLRKIRAHFPNWRIEYDLPDIISGIVERRLSLWRAAS
jgi:CDP-paratose 2-epimerase